MINNILQVQCRSWIDETIPW